MNQIRFRQCLENYTKFETFREKSEYLKISHIDKLSYSSKNGIILVIGVFATLALPKNTPSSI